MMDESMKVDNMERRPRPGEIYRHFKGRLYQVITVAKHTETGEELVIYQALYGDFGIYARPLSMFVSEVDREKYPNATQRYRFEKMERVGTFLSMNAEDEVACDAPDKPGAERGHEADHEKPAEAKRDPDLAELNVEYLRAKNDAVQKGSRAANAPKSGIELAGGKFSAEHMQRVVKETGQAAPKKDQQPTREAKAGQKAEANREVLRQMEPEKPAVRDVTRAEASHRPGREKFAKRKPEPEKSDINPKLMAFLETESFEERYKILSTMRDEVDDTMIDTMAVVMDAVIPDGDIATRYDDLRHVIRTRQKYEFPNRLR